MGRPLLRLAPTTLERLQEDGLLAEHVRALDRPNRHGQVVAGAQHVRANEARLLGGRDGRFEPGRRRRVVAADGDDGLAGADRVGRDREAFDDRIRIGLEEEAIGEGGRIGAVTVGHDEAARRRRRRREPPFVRGREAGPTAAAQLRGGDRGDRPRCAELVDRSPQAVERAAPDGGVEIRRVRPRARRGLRACQQDSRPFGRRPQDSGHPLSEPSR